MLKKLDFFSNLSPINWWLDQVKLSPLEKYTLDTGCKFITTLNGDIHDLDNSYVENDYSSAYKIYKNKLLEKTLAYNINYNDYDIILKKRSTIHIRELFDKHVDNNTLVIASSYQHISADTVLDKVKNIVKIDTETDEGNVITHIEEAIKKAKKFKKVFVYFIATEFQTGRNYSQAIFDEIYNKIKGLKCKSIFVLDAVQEMFLLPRDWSKYDYIIGTAHATYFGFDTGFLIINTKKQNLKGFSGYKRDDVLKYLNEGLDIILKRHKYIMMYQKIINDSISHELIENATLHNSQTNFYSLFVKDNELLTNNDCLRILKRKFIEPATQADPGVNVEISHHKPYDELYIRVRAQTLMFDEKDITNKLNYFTTNYKKVLAFKD